MDLDGQRSGQILMVIMINGGDGDVSKQEKRKTELYIGDASHEEIRLSDHILWFGFLLLTGQSS